MFLKNREQLLSEELTEKQKRLRELALDCMERALNAVKPDHLIENQVEVKQNRLVIMDREINLEKVDKIYIVGGGKATAEMAFSLEKKLASIVGISLLGSINIPKGLELERDNITGNISIYHASHPIPDEIGLQGSKNIIKLIENTAKNDLVIALISGGGSALMPLPKEGITLKDIQAVNKLLIASGASIHEINTIRKHLSDFKGGNLAKKLHKASGAMLITLIISDVIGDNLDIIASGPTVPDSSTFQDALKILEKYSLSGKVPKLVLQLLKKGSQDPTLENPKEGDDCFNNVHNYLIGSVRTAVGELSDFLNKRSYAVQYYSDQISGEAREYGVFLNNYLKDKIKETKKFGNLAIMGTGELTVTVKGKGMGGRNQEMLLSFLNQWLSEPIEFPFLIMSLNLDGIEGNSEAAGALIDNQVMNVAAQHEKSISQILDNNDSGSFFKEWSKTQIITGPTGCNVNDLVLILLPKEP